MTAHLQEHALSNGPYMEFVDVLELGNVGTIK